MNDLLKKAIAECVGTFVLVFVACGVAGATGGSLVATSLALLELIKRHKATAEQILPFAEILIKNIEENGEKVSDVN